MPSRDRAPKSICASGGNELQLMRPFEAEEGAFQQLWRFLTTFLSGSSSLPLQHAARRPSDLGSAVWQMDDMDLVERPSGYSERLEGLFAAAKLGESKWTSTTSSLDQMPSNRLSCCVGTTADEEASQTPRMSTRWSVARTRMSERGAAANALLSTFQSTVRQSLNLSRLRRSEAQQPAEACRPAWAAYRGQRPRGSNRERSSRSTDEDEADSAVELPVDDAAAERPPRSIGRFHIEQWRRRSRCRERAGTSGVGERAAIASTAVEWPRKSNEHRKVRVAFSLVFSYVLCSSHRCPLLVSLDRFLFVQCAGDVTSCCTISAQGRISRFGVAEARVAGRSWF